MKSLTFFKSIVTKGLLVFALIAQQVAPVAHMQTEAPASSAVPLKFIPVLQKVNYFSSDILYDVQRDKIYASGFGEGIAVINLDTGVIEKTLSKNGSGGALALSGDANSLYATPYSATVHSDLVQKLNLTNETIERQFSLGDSIGAYDIAVHPNQPNTIAVTRYYLSLGDLTLGVAMYDADVIRPNVADAAYDSTHIAFSDDGNALFGTSSFNSDLQKIVVTPSGLNISTTIPISYSIDLVQKSGNLYLNSGEVVSANTMQKIATLPASGFIAPVTTFNRVYVLDPALTNPPIGANYPIRLHVFDLNSFAPLTYVDLPNIEGSPWSFKLVATGNNRFAFKNASYIYILKLIELPYQTYLPIVAKPDPAAIVRTYPFANRCAPFFIRQNNEDKARVDLCVTSVQIRLDGKMKFNVKWTVTFLANDINYVYKNSDQGNPNMNVTDTLGNRYDHVELGGAAGQVVYFYRGGNNTAEGSYTFPPAKPGANNFIFHDDDQNIDIDNLILSP